MYCRKCGKQIDYDAPVCKECAEAEFFQNYGQPAPGADTTRPTPAPVGNGSVRAGFGGALTSTILGSVAFILGIVVMSMIAATVEYGYYDASLITAGYVLTVMVMGMAIPALILGIKGIKTFTYAKNHGHVKPIPSLVLGIAGLSAGAFSILYAFLSFVLCSLI